AMPKLPPIKPTPTTQTFSNILRFAVGGAGFESFSRSSNPAPRTLNTSSHRFGDGLEFVHQFRELLGVHGLLSVRKRVFGMRVYFDQQSVRAGGNGGFAHRGHHV